MSGGLPPVPNDVSPGARRFFQQVKNVLEVGDGHRKDKRQRYLRVEDLYRIGLVRGSVGNFNLVPGVVPGSGVGDKSIPPAPTGFQVVPGFNYIHLIWDSPYGLYNNHALTYILRNTIDNIANAVIVGQDVGSQFADLAVVRGTTYYYWIYFVSTANIEGPPNSSVGISATLSPDPSDLLQVLSGQITESQLYATLNSRIDLIDAPVTGIIDRLSGLDSSIGSNQTLITQLQTDLTAAEGDIAANSSAITALDTRVTTAEGNITSQSSSITALQSSVANAQSDTDANAIAITSLDTRVTTAEGNINSQASSITQLQTSVGTNTATIQTQATSIAGVEAQYTVKTDVNGHVAGYGLATTVSEYNGAIHSTMLFSVDSFAIASPGATSMSFIVDGGRVVMDAANIVNLVVNNAQIQSLAADKLTGFDTNFILSNIGTGNITYGYIEQVLQSTNYPNGGFRLDRTNGIEIRDSTGAIMLRSWDNTLSSQIDNAQQNASDVNGLGNLATLNQVSGVHIGNLSVDTLHLLNNAVTLAVFSELADEYIDEFKTSETTGTVSVSGLGGPAALQIIVSGNVRSNGNGINRVRLYLSLNGGAYFVAKDFYIGTEGQWSIPIFFSYTTPAGVSDASAYLHLQQSPVNSHRQDYLNMGLSFWGGKK